MILQINFSFDMPVAEYRKMSESALAHFLDMPGLRWKIWLLNPAARAYVNGPLVAKLRGHASIQNVSIEQFEFMGLRQ